ncbi:unnamed protein product, partial [marine sediment metagenome]
MFGATITIAFGAGAVLEVYPEWWGARGDGVTSCTVGIQSALDSNSNAADSMKVVLGKGIYMFGQLSLDTYAHLAGVGQGLTVLRAITATNDDLIVHADSPGSQVIITDLLIDGESTNQTAGSCIKFSSVHNVWIERVTLTDAKEYGLELVTCNNVQFSNGQITDCQAGGFIATTSEQCNLTNSVLELNENFEATYISAATNAVSHISGCWFESS